MAAITRNHKLATIDLLLKITYNKNQTIVSLGQFSIKTCQPSWVVDISRSNKIATK